jgi:hypothetical protein
LRIVYLILCHKEPKQVSELVQRLDSDGVSFVIHVDARSKGMEAELKDLLFKFHNVKFARRYRCYWGQFGIVKGTLSCIEKALETSFDYAVLLSGQDYPVKTNQSISAFLKEHSGSEFIECFQIHRPNRWTGQSGAYQAARRAHALVFSFRSRMWCTRLMREFPLGYNPHGGTQWWCLSYEALRYIAEFVSRNTAYSRYFRFTLTPDELFFQSIIANSDYATRIAHKITYDDWNDPNPPYPKILDESDFEKLRDSRWLFARKFDYARSDKLRMLLDK